MSDVVSLLQDLVRIPSINPASARSEESAGEGLLAETIEQWLAEAGVPVARQTVAPGRHNLLAVVPGQGQPGLLLEAHLDTVGAAGMSHPPFSGEIRDGRVWGRGACDDKASVAAMLLATRRAARENLPCGLLLALVVDEEYGFTGIERLLAEPLPLAVRGAVVGEPTGLEVIDRHGGAVRMRLTAHGRAAHSAYPEAGDNAIYHAMRLVEACERHHAELQQRDLDGVRTCSVTLIEGGEAVNIIPESCALTVDRRLAPGERPEAVRAMLEALLAAAAQGHFACETAALLLDPPLSPREPAPLAELCLRLAGEVTGQRVRRGVTYSTDASNLAETGLEAVVLGPGDIAQAHGAEEWVDAEQVEQAAEIYYRLAVGVAEM